jgi:hypothetical protein
MTVCKAEESFVKIHRTGAVAATAPQPGEFSPRCRTRRVLCHIRKDDGTIAVMVNMPSKMANGFGPCPVYGRRRQWTRGGHRSGCKNQEPSIVRSWISSVALVTRHCVTQSIPTSTPRPAPSPPQTSNMFPEWRQRDGAEVRTHEDGHGRSDRE